MTTPSSLLSDLEDTIRSGSGEQRSAMLRHVTTLFLDTAPCATEAQVAMFDDVFESLVEKIESKAMRELSERMSAVANAPIRLIRRLARDEEIEVSGPVLSHSPRLADGDLVAIARTRGQAHLAAIAGRKTLGEPVTDVLVERGDAAVARKVAGNAGARLTERSIVALIDKVGEDDDLAHAIAQRRELSPGMFRRLLASASEHVRERLRQDAQPGAAEAIDATVAEVSRDLEAAILPKRDYEEARRNVSSVATGHVASMALLQFARTRKTDEMTVALSDHTGVAVDVVSRFLDDTSDDPILLVCRAIDLDWVTTFAVLIAKHGDDAINDSQADDLQRRYRKLSSYSAQRVLRFWQARSKLAQAG